MTLLSREMLFTQTLTRSHVIAPTYVKLQWTSRHAY
jgi:hypothetical protein